MFGIMKKDDCEFFIKIRAKIYASQLFKLLLRYPRPTQLPLPPGPGWKTIDWNSSPPHLHFTRVLLVNVSKSGLIFEFFTFFCSEFDTNFTGVLFSWFLSFFGFLSIVKKEFCSKFFKVQKCQLSKPITIYGKVKNRFFFTNVFLHDSKHFLDILFI